MAFRYGNLRKQKNCFVLWLPFIVMFIQNNLIGVKMDNKKFTPFSKKNVLYARLEAYIFSLILIVMVWLEKDVSAIAILISLAWGGYKLIQGLYIKMAEREHLEELKQGRRLYDLDISDLDIKIEELENKNIESEEY